MVEGYVQVVLTFEGGITRTCPSTTSWFPSPEGEELLGRLIRRR